MKILLTGILFLMGFEAVFSQVQEAGDQVVDLLSTYGNMTVMENTSDASTRTLFFALPMQSSGSFYVRVFDPDCGGEYDRSNGLWETNTEFEVFGGTGCICIPGSVGGEAKSSGASGTLLDEKIFAYEPGIDGTWVTFGPFAVEQGEKLEGYDARFFKLLVVGTCGNDSNQFAVYLSSSDIQNKAVNGAAMYNNVYAFNEDLQKGKYSISLSAEPIEE